MICSFALPIFIVAVINLVGSIICSCGLLAWSFPTFSRSRMAVGRLVLAMHPGRWTCMEPTNHPFRKPKVFSKPPRNYVQNVNLQGCKAILGRIPIQKDHFGVTPKWPQHGCIFCWFSIHHWWPTPNCLSSRPWLEWLVGSLGFGPLGHNPFWPLWVFVAALQPAPLAKNLQVVVSSTEVTASCFLLLLLLLLLFMTFEKTTWTCCDVEFVPKLFSFISYHKISKDDLQNNLVQFPSLEATTFPLAMHVALRL